jgi:hypothetical protein
MVILLDSNRSGIKPGAFHQEQTRTFIAARIAAGKTKKDAIRILKRYLARHIYHLLLQPPTTPALAA